MREVEEKIVQTIKDSGDDGITARGLKRRTAGTKTFSMLVDISLMRLLDAGVIVEEKRKPNGGGRGRPLKVFTIRRGTL